MPPNIKTPKQSLSPAFLKQPPNREEIELFRKEFNTLFDRINAKESEEFHKNLIKDFLNAVYYRDKHYINTKGKTDLVIHNGKEAASQVGVLIETKSPANKTEIPRFMPALSPSSSHSHSQSPALSHCTGAPCGCPNEKGGPQIGQSQIGRPQNGQSQIGRPQGSPLLNVKSFHELLLYYLRERKTGKNFELRYLIITNVYEWFVFDARNFEDTFGSDKDLVKNFNEFENKTSAATKTDTFYKEIAAPAIDKHIDNIQFTYFDIRHYENLPADNDDFVALYKFLSPVHLLKRDVLPDNNRLNTKFYDELLHILGLTETKSEGKIKIERKEKNRDEGSLLELTIAQLETADFDVALSLVITWINRILFLKLLEAQLLKYHDNHADYAFLSPDGNDAINRVSTFNHLNTLFFQILAKKTDERPNYLHNFENVPYLNSSLFEETDLEKILKISLLSNDVFLPLYEKTVLTGKTDNALEYLLRFLNAYNFSGNAEAGENSENLISAAVLGLIFEKINGYKDGSFFTPSFITMYMCRETIGRAAIQKFNEAKGWNCSTIADLHNHIGKNTDDIKCANQIFNSIRICDPAVGSGHFLVSALNEMIYLKAELGILADENYKTLNAYQIDIVSNELTIRHNGEFFRYIPANAESARVQKTLFHEKQTIIENCLFGVDINPNSVKICQLRLWIELLKHAYYVVGAGLAPAQIGQPQLGQPQGLPLQTLPNIDINIKCGNSLISRFTLDDKYADNPALQQKVIQATKRYKEWVFLYKQCDDKETKRQITKNIEAEKDFFYRLNNAKDPDYQNLQKAQNQLTLHTQSFNFFDDQTAEWNAKTAELTDKVTKLEKLYHDKIRGCFEWRFEFPELLDDDGNFAGFDVVIGNPPYGIVYDMLLKKEYERKYPEFIRNNDLYVAFINRGLTLLKRNGVFSLITPNTYFKGNYYTSLRKLLQQFQIIEIVDFGIRQVFTEANVFTSIFLLKKDIPQEKWILKSDFSSVKGNIKSNELDFILKNPLVQRLDKITKLEEFAKIKDCGYNYWTIGKGKTRHNSIGSRILYFSDNKENELDIPYYKGSNIQKYSLSEPKQFLRHNYNDFLNENDVFRFSADLLEHKPKIIYRQTSSSLIAALDENGFHNDKTVHLIIPNNNFDVRFILGLFNSKLINYYYQQINSEQGRAFAQVKTVYIKQLPIPEISIEQQKPLIALVNQILSAKKENRAADTLELEREIDLLVYGLYGLTEGEIEMIENK